MKYIYKMGEPYVWKIKRKCGLTFYFMFCWSEGFEFWFESFKGKKKSLKLSYMCGVKKIILPGRNLSSDEERTRNSFFFFSKKKMKSPPNILIIENLN
jgi:hypothetical protein